MTIRPVPTLAVLAVALGLAAGPAAAGEMAVVTSVGNYSVGVVSLKEARFKNVVRQQFDFSCGSAAVATLLTYHYGRPTTEEQAFQAMWESGDQAAIQNRGFSLHDMQRYLASLGLKSDGFRLDLDKLAEVGVPAITLINIKGYNHFVVVKGVTDKDVLVGDPALGVRSIPREQFNGMWRNIAFLIRDEVETGRENFNHAEEWAVRRKAPFGTALSRNGLATFHVALPGLFQF